MAPIPPKSGSHRRVSAQTFTRGKLSFCLSKLLRIESAFRCVCRHTHRIPQFLVELLDGAGLVEHLLPETDCCREVLENDGWALKTLIRRIPNHTFITRNVEDETSTNEMIDNYVVDLYN
jgi:hypothetical protein